MTGPNYYDKDGTPLDLGTWVQKFQDDSYKRVAFDRIGFVTVSTVWLGLDHQYSDGPPLIFETLIIEGDNDGDMWRYSTEAEALEGHAAALELVNA